MDTHVKSRRQWCKAMWRASVCCSSGWGRCNAARVCGPTILLTRSWSKWTIQVDNWGQISTVPLP